MPDSASREQAPGEDPRGGEGVPRGVGPGGGTGGYWPLVLWSAVIAAAVLPWWSYQPHSHWSRIIWVPFSTPPPLALRDLVANVLLYVPFGVFYARWQAARLTARRLAATGLLAALALSGATEITQVYSHGRFPSMTDVTLNIGGAWVGLAVAGRFGRPRPGLLIAPPPAETR